VGLGASGPRRRSSPVEELIGLVMSFGFIAAALFGKSGWTVAE
jgi:hypothetical protein